MQKKFAVFDIDGTIVRNSLLRQTIHEMISRDIVDAKSSREIELMLHQIKLRTSKENYTRYIKKTISSLFKSIPNGLKITEYDSVTDAVIKTATTNTFAYSQQLLNTLKNNGYFLIAISNSEMRVVSKLCKKLGFDAWVGETSFSVTNNKLDGNVQIITRSRLDILQALIKKFNLQTKNSTAICDSIYDLEILQNVNSPIVFNPDQDLFKQASQNGWMIALERKDVVYGLVKEKGTYVLKQVNV